MFLKYIADNEYLIAMIHRKKKRKCSDAISIRRKENIVEAFDLENRLSREGEKNRHLN